MCGATDGDFWETSPSRRIILAVKPRAGDVSHAWVICDECHEGLLELRAKQSSSSLHELQRRFAKRRTAKA
jgi:hypothetical protein